MTGGKVPGSIGCPDSVLQVHQAGVVAIGLVGNKKNLEQFGGLLTIRVVP